MRPNSLTKDKNACEMWNIQKKNTFSKFEDLERFVCAQQCNNLYASVLIFLKNMKIITIITI